jgi:hypothetical protein
MTVINVTEAERATVEKMLAAMAENPLLGDTDNDKLIRFGYLSLEERQRLRQHYPDLWRRFEPQYSDMHELHVAIGAYCAFLVGIYCGIVEGLVGAIVLGVIVSIVYWIFAGIALRGLEKAQEERRKEYWEWRGYRPR